MKIQLQNTVQIKISYEVVKNKNLDEGIVAPPFMAGYENIGNLDAGL
jgi:hypothetical protein